MVTPRVEFEDLPELQTVISGEFAVRQGGQTYRAPASRLPLAPAAPSRQQVYNLLKLIAVLAGGTLTYDDDAETITWPAGGGGLTPAQLALLNSALQPADLRDRPTDAWANYLNDFQSWANNQTVQGIQFFTGVPSDTTKVAFADLTPVNITGVTQVWVSKSVYSSSDYIGGGTEQFPQPSGDIIFAPYDANEPYATFTIASVVDVSTGNNPRWQLTGTMAQSANWNPGGSGLLKISDTLPAKARIDEDAINLNGAFLARLRLLDTWGQAMAAGMSDFIEDEKNDDPLPSDYISLRTSFRDLLNAIFARLDGSNLTAAFRADVRGPWEPYTVTADQVRLANNSALATANRWQVTPEPALGGSAVNFSWRLNATDYAKVVEHWALDRRIVFSTGTLRVAGSVNELGNHTLQATVELVEGALPAVNATGERPTVRGVPTWSDVLYAIRASGTADDDHLVTEKAVRDALGAKGDAEDTVPFAAAFRDSYSRTFASTLTGNDTGEATTSSDNTVPGGAPAGTTAFVALDKATAGGTDQTAELEKVGVGDWMRAKSGANYIIARIAFIQKSLSGDFEFWFNPSTAIDDTLQYDTLPNGAGEIRFYRQHEAPDLSGLTLAESHTRTGMADGTYYYLNAANTSAAAYDYDDDDYILVNVIDESGGSKGQAALAGGRFGDIPTGSDDPDSQWTNIPSDGRRWSLRRNGSHLQWARHTSNISGEATIRVRIVKGVKGDKGDAAPWPAVSDSFTAASLALDGTEQTIATANITPSSTSRKIKVEFNATLTGDRTNAGDIDDSVITIKVKRGNIIIRTEGREWQTHVSSANKVTAQTVVLLVDSPASVAQQTYTVTATRGAAAENAAAFNRSLMLMEV